MFSKFDDEHRLCLLTSQPCDLVSNISSFRQNLDLSSSFHHLVEQLMFAEEQFILTEFKQTVSLNYEICQSSQNMICF